MSIPGGAEGCDPRTWVVAHLRGGRALSTARACLAAVLRLTRPTRVYVPFYICNTVLQPMVDAGAEIRFYAIDERFFPIDPPLVRDDELFLYTNYFGLCDAHVATLAARYARRLVIDDTHAFFVGPRAGIVSFNSARKFFPVSDGAFLFSSDVCGNDVPRFDAPSLGHLMLRRLGRHTAAAAAAARYERLLDAGLRRISAAGQWGLRGVDFADHAHRRRENYRILHAGLGASNRLALNLVPDDGVVPICYPYLAHGGDAAPIRRRMGFDVLPMWADVWRRATEDFAWERHVSRLLLPLPVDSRFSTADMRHLAGCVPGTVIGERGACRT